MTDFDVGKLAPEKTFQTRKAFASYVMVWSEVSVRRVTVEDTSKLRLAYSCAHHEDCQCKVVASVVNDGDDDEGKEARGGYAYQRACVSHSMTEMYPFPFDYLTHQFR